MIAPTTSLWVVGALLRSLRALRTSVCNMASSFAASFSSM